MFRDDHDALAMQNAELRRELDRLQGEHAAMQRALASIQRGDRPELVPTPATLYRGDLAGLTEGLRAAYSAHTLTPTPLWKLLTLHMLTFGISSVVHFARMSERLPQLSQDDPTALKAALGFFLPYYNLYWLFAFPLRLTDRINLQFRLRGAPPPVSRELVVAAGVLSVPLYFLLPIFWILPAWHAQRAVNKLCELGHGATTPDARTGVRVDAQPAAAQAAEVSFADAQHAESLAVQGDTAREGGATG